MIGQLVESERDPERKWPGRDKVIGMQHLENVSKYMNDCRSGLSNLPCVAN